MTLPAPSPIPIDMRARSVALAAQMACRELDDYGVPLRLRALFEQIGRDAEALAAELAQSASSETPAPINRPANVVSFRRRQA